MPAFIIATSILGTISLLLSRVSHRLAFQCGTVWGWCMCRVNWTPVKVVGREKARKNQAYVIMTNHQSQFDILAFYGHWGRQFRWVMKQELRKVPFIGWSTAALNNIFIDRSNRESAIASLKAAQPLFDQGISVLIFPEGTRSIDGKLREFKKGGFMLALDTGLPILPISISGTHRILPGKTLKLLPGRVRITVHDPIPTAGLGPADRDELMARVRSAIESGL
ncbi:MAG: 1-acyl-sn-glycerol-3-phosphate acyltransferase [Deltaproteobacteria bacterium]|nr:1-acyl-sn-glycerol-3-phosphate acyltransferase [Deltaproteobacteria bacterium]